MPFSATIQRLAADNGAVLSLQPGARSRHSEERGRPRTEGRAPRPRAPRRVPLSRCALRPPCRAASGLARRRHGSRAVPPHRGVVARAPRVGPLVDRADRGPRSSPASGRRAGPSQLAPPRFPPAHDRRPGRHQRRPNARRPRGRRSLRRSCSRRSKPQSSPGRRPCHGSSSSSTTTAAGGATASVRFASSSRNGCSRSARPTACWRSRSPGSSRREGLPTARVPALGRGRWQALPDRRGMAGADGGRRGRRLGDPEDLRRVPERHEPAEPPHARAGGGASGSPGPTSSGDPHTSPARSPRRSRFPATSGLMRACPKSRKGTLYRPQPNCAPARCSEVGVSDG